MKKIYKIILGAFAFLFVLGAIVGPQYDIEQQTTSATPVTSNTTIPESTTTTTPIEPQIEKQENKTFRVFFIFPSK